MKLEHEDVELFYELMWALQFYAKEQLHLFPEIRSIEEYQICDSKIKLQVRHNLFEQRTLIDTFVSENPQQLSSDHLELVDSWKKAICGDFYIERMLKQHTILIAEDNRVYGIVGLYDDFDEMIHKGHLPMLIKTILLPFQGKITYDGLFQPYKIHSKDSVWGDLKESYLSAKQNGRIIKSLDDSAILLGRKKRIKLKKNWSPQLKKLATSAKKLRSKSSEPAINNPAFKLISVSIEFGQVATKNPCNRSRLRSALKKVERAVLAIEQTIQRMD